MRISFVISSLLSGGAERVAVTLMNEWAKVGHDLEFITYEPRGQKSHYKINPAIKITQLDLLNNSTSKFSFLFNNFKKITFLRNAIIKSRPDVVISFITETNNVTLISSIGKSWPLIISERIHPGFHPVRKIDDVIRRISYRWADAIIVQTRPIQQWVKKELKLGSKILPNPIELRKFKQPDNRQNHIKNKIISVGRLDHQKRFSDLISAFAKISANNPNWILEIYGKGPLEHQLQEQIEVAQLSSQVFLCGTSDKIEEKLWECAIYVHTAHYEGFPNAIVEALAAGCCVLSTDGPTAAAELIGDNEFGLLATNGDVADISNKMTQLILNEETRLEYQKKAPARVADLDVEQIALQWLNYIADVRSNNG